MTDNKLPIPCDNCKEEHLSLEQKDVKGKLMRLCKKCIKDFPVKDIDKGIEHFFGGEK